MKARPCRSICTVLALCRSRCRRGRANWIGGPILTARRRRGAHPATWRKALLPQLAGLRQVIAPPNRVCLGGSASLAAGFAFGHTFKEVARYGLEVEQFVEGTTQRWRS